MSRAAVMPATPPPMTSALRPSSTGTDVAALGTAVLSLSEDMATSDWAFLVASSLSGFTHASHSRTSMNYTRSGWMPALAASARASLLHW